MYVCNIRHFFLSFFALLGPLGLILGQHFLKRCSNAAIPWSGNFLGGPKKQRYYNRCDENDLLHIFNWLKNFSKNKSSFRGL